MDSFIYLGTGVHLLSLISSMKEAERRAPVTPRAACAGPQSNQGRRRHVGEEQREVPELLGRLPSIASARRGGGGGESHLLPAPKFLGYAHAGAGHDQLNLEQADCLRILGSSLDNCTYEIVNASAVKTFSSKN
jgi:hypothetical protein